jgi:hypothetical protein
MAAALAIAAPVWAQSNLVAPPTAAPPTALPPVAEPPPAAAPDAAPPAAASEPGAPAAQATPKRRVARHATHHAPTRAAIGEGDQITQQLNQQVLQGTQGAGAPPAPPGGMPPAPGAMPPPSAR